VRFSSLLPEANIGRDVTWKIRQSSKWTVVELNCAIVAACIPPIKALIVSFFQKATPMGDYPHNKTTSSKPPLDVTLDSWAQMRDHIGDSEC
jgi:hypothetical protein